ncbi:lysosome-associated membrane glycoprotein 1-like isoform X2 [Mytilus californianus]|uniref:lysosome-associated membrane glycoprotein 1-like isoform X2 n=1 Tax=Mytilus californianus TaxID=6549 RepID=UPI002245DA75|nr:lysosome-associated membrane glycoprotein 1-like isoform X2 [Mytilus californianus]
MNGFTLLITALLLIGCSAKKVRYPDPTKPCIMMDMSANLTLLMKSNASKTESTLEGGAMGSGVCGQSLSSVDLTFASGVQGSLDFSFQLGADSNVKMDLALTFTPDFIFKNGDTGIQTAKTVSSTQLSTMTASYTCTEPRVIKFNTVTGKDGEEYDFSMTISNVQIQAFNVSGTTYSPAEDCTAIDGITTEAAMTSQAPAQTTEKNKDTTSEAPPATTQPTTKPPTNESTSEAPTTKPPTNESTSEAPPTTPAQPTTTAKMPKPGSPDVNTYKASNGNGTCLMFKAGIEFTLPIPVKGTNVTKTLGIHKEDKSNDTEFAGDCDASNTTETMTITFYKTSTILMTFTKTDTGYYFSDVDIKFDLNKELFPDIDKPVTLSVRKTFTKSQFAADKDGSYKCNDKSDLEVMDGVNMRTYNLQYAAFQKNITEFKSSGISECSADSDTNSVVPIAVGAALAGLVVIVLIAYLIGRKRSRQSGYEQV